eukprot:CAMPEP_0172387404 /NCGR_PEP_ID=MMETSP1061-20121228/4714_1 /TAXON_ID=37318 /ORGANISM="Pseudo-nitzschia pungens, Strain cf. pungens" /LENGTH=1072 /DNA_ID=CAMNT_0013117021 /DNA_START=161 /DNA_END=3379 /DNA_ORIENTATION=+
MRFHPLAVSVVVGALALSTKKVDAFVLPKSATTRSASTTAWMAGQDPYTSLEENLFNPTPNANDVTNYNDATEMSADVNNGNDAVNSDSVSTEAPKKEKPQRAKKLNKRAEKLRAQLEADLAAAEESRVRAAQQLAEAEASRQALEAEASKAAQEAEALEAKFNALEATKTASTGGMSAAGIVGEIAGPLVGGFATFGGLAVARDSLSARNKKAEEERLKREEEERKAEEAAKRKAEQEAQSKAFLPIFGAGVAGLGAFGAFFGSGSGGGGSSGVDSIVDPSANPQPGISQESNAGKAIPEPSATVEMPYLEKEIAKAETKNKQQKEKPPRPKTARQLAREAAEAQRATEARLEQKLAEAPELARKAAEAEAKAAAEAQAAEQARIEAERKAAEEKAIAEAQAAEQARIESERKAAEAQAAEQARIQAERKAAEAKAAEAKAAEQARLETERKAAQEKAAAEARAAEQARIEAERKAAEAKAAEQARIEAERKAAEAKAAEQARIEAERKAAEEKAIAQKKAAEAKAIAQKKAVEKKAAEEAAAAAERAKAEKLAADKLAFEKMKAEAEEKAKAEKLAADKLAFEKMRVEEEAKAQAKIQAEQAAAIELLRQQEEEATRSFFPKVPAVSDMLFGNLKPSEISDKGLSNIFSPNKLVVGGVALAGLAVAAAVIAANESPSVSSTFKVTGKTPKEFLESKDTKADGPPSEDPTLRKTIRIPQSDAQKNEVSADKSVTSPPPGSKEALREQLAKQRDNLNRQAAEKLSTTQETSAPSNSLPDADIASTEASNNENVGDSSPGSIPAPPKKSYSPFGGGKPKAVGNDSLYAPPASQASAVDTSFDAPAVDASAGAPEQIYSNDAIPDAVPKKSYSPFGGGKPKAVGNDSLYAPPANIIPTFEDTTDSGIPASDASFSTSFQEELTSDDSTPLTNVSPPIPKSYSPFGGRKPMAATNDPLYRPMTPQTSSEGYDDYSSLGDEPSVASPDPMAFSAEVSPSPPRNYSPFGGAKPFASYDDSLYSPPSDDTFDVDEALPRAETDILQTPPVKKSYSPFGLKPQAPGDRGFNGGGYLDEL